MHGGVNVFCIIMTDMNFHGASQQPGSGTGEAVDAFWTRVGYLCTNWLHCWGKSPQFQAQATNRFFCIKILQTSIVCCRWLVLMTFLHTLLRSVAKSDSDLHTKYAFHFLCTFLCPESTPTRIQPPQASTTRIVARLWSSERLHWAETPCLGCGQNMHEKHRQLRVTWHTFCVI